MIDDPLATMVVLHYATQDNMVLYRRQFRFQGQPEPGDRVWVGGTAAGTLHAKLWGYRTWTRGGLLELHCGLYEWESFTRSRESRFAAYERLGYTMWTTQRFGSFSELARKSGWSVVMPPMGEST